MTEVTETEAYEAMLEHHKRLAGELAERADAVARAVAAEHPYGAPVASLIAYLAEDVLPHAAAEEKTVYPAAAEHADLEGVVGEMTAEHVTLSALAAGLAALADGAAAAAQAQRITGLFTAHAARENDVLLPALLGDESVDLAAVLGQMHDGGRENASDDAHAPADAGRAGDSQATVVTLLLQAAAALARAGEADRACTIAASAWAALRDGRPDLAAKVTAGLHGLARRVDEGPGRPAATAVTLDPLLDVRDLAPARRHTAIFGAYWELEPGAGFILVNDHDPKPLRYQFEAEHPGQFTWEYLENGPGVWRVRIGRPVVTVTVGGGAEEPDLDVRPVSHGQRHEQIFAAYQALSPGAGFVLVNDHDPRPLRYQFEAQHAGDYTWDYLETGPQEWRVRIGRASAEGESVGNA